MTEGLVTAKVFGIVDGRFGAQRPAFFEVLFDVALFIVQMEARLNAFLDDPAAKLSQRGLSDFTVKE